MKIGSSRICVGDFQAFQRVGSMHIQVAKALGAQSPTQSAAMPRASLQ